MDLKRQTFARSAQIHPGSCAESDFFAHQSQ
jgi:hypothetical protein